MLLIMGSWRGADAPWSGALVGLTLILGSIQALGGVGCVKAFALHGMG